MLHYPSPAVSAEPLFPLSLLCTYSSSLHRRDHCTPLHPNLCPCCLLCHECPFSNFFTWKTHTWSLGSVQTSLQPPFPLQPSGSQTTASLPVALQQWLPVSHILATFDHKWLFPCVSPVPNSELLKVKEWLCSSLHHQRLAQCGHCHFKWNNSSTS